MIVSLLFLDTAMQQAVKPTQLVVVLTNGCINTCQTTVSFIALHIRHSLRDRLRAVECPSDIVDAIGGWKTSGVGHGYGNGYPLEVLEKWMRRL